MATDWSKHLYLRNIIILKVLSSSHSLLHPDIAANQVTDVREVLDYYKSFEGKSVLEVFSGTDNLCKIVMLKCEKDIDFIVYINFFFPENQKKLRSEIESLESKKKSSSHGKSPGSISVFSLGSASKQYSSEVDQQQLDISADNEGTRDDEGSTSSLIGWIGTWVGWK